MSWNKDRTIQIAVLGVAIVAAIGTWLALPPAYKLIGSEPSVDSRMEVAVKQETQVRKPAQTQEQVGQESSAQSNAAEESKRNSVPKAYPENFRFLVGEWESTTPGNNWQMRVSWDGKSGQFLGYLTKQGQASQAYGFRIGERVWTAEPIDEQTFVERQKFRGGFGNSWWNTQNVDVRESSRDHLSGYVEFKRVQ